MLIDLGLQTPLDIGAEPAGVCLGALRGEALFSGALLLQETEPYGAFDLRFRDGGGMCPEGDRWR